MVVRNANNHRYKVKVKYHLYNIFIRKINAQGKSSNSKRSKISLISLIDLNHDKHMSLIDLRH